MKQIVLRCFGGLGMLLFVPLFLMTFTDPQLIENSGKSFIEWKPQEETNEKIDSIDLPKANRFENLLGKKATELLQQTKMEIDAIKQQLKEDSPTLIAEQIAKMRNLDCDCRKKWETHLKISMELHQTSLETAKEKLIKFSQAKYMDILQRLTLDVRIFLGTNATIFIVLFLVSFLKPQAINHLFLPNALMLVSTVICSYFYLFEQNWFYTIIYNNYTGYGYIGYLSVVFAILCDIVFNKARITTDILNTLLSAIGNTTNFSPC